MFKNIFKKGEKQQEIPENTVKVNWVKLTDVAQLEKVDQDSQNNLVGIFKHSTRCIISKTVLSNFEKMVSNNQLSNTFYYLDLLNYRDISNKIEEKYQVMHQSPQLLLIKNGEVVEHASHYDISQLNVDKFGK
ncbi:bacillithiol system redox-active protein YtxJ [Tenacibaculum sp. IB213877]|uniref:bacillithiol system redox-active protein YtxJ n=1 Tax=Tenacibaculum sp. IB213877 TaxID=3097351 RepID=UPI002A5ABE99|nr:bacillithiol system redox-active protein YtxJ [Tenacibaculum sp. IB213877]MDY0779578.1 bacillithiol system redox-active protein YtxJ [Tenacibaculum sp. IB213877]